MMKKVRPYWLAKFDHASVVLPGLFRSLTKGSEHRKQPLHIEHVFEESDTFICVKAPELLGGDDLKVLQGLVGIATESARPYCTALQDFNSGLRRTAPEPVSARSTCTMPELCRASGYRSRSTTGYDAIRASIRRLEQVTIQLSVRGVPTSPAGERFLTVHRLADKAPNLVDVGFHSSLQAAILAVADGDVYVKVNLDEARLHRTNPARVLHHRLSYLNEGRRQEFKRQTLENYIYVEDGIADTARARCHRRKEAAEAWNALRSDSGWKVVEDDNTGLVAVTRKRDARSKPRSNQQHAMLKARSARLECAK